LNTEKEISKCPEYHLFKRYKSQECTREEAFNFERHLHECSFCSIAYEGYLAQEDSAFENQLKEIRKELFTKLFPSNRAMVISLLAALLIFTVGYFYFTNQPFVQLDQNIEQHENFAENEIIEKVEPDEYKKQPKIQPTEPLAKNELNSELKKTSEIASSDQDKPGAESLVTTDEAEQSKSVEMNAIDLSEAVAFIESYSRKENRIFTTRPEPRINIADDKSVAEEIQNKTKQSPPPATPQFFSLTDQNVSKVDSAEFSRSQVQMFVEQLKNRNCTEAEKVLSGLKEPKEYILFFSAIVELCKGKAENASLILSEIKSDDSKLNNLIQKIQNSIR
jgi:hypothetical protein